jgi:TPR repeat protein
MSSIYFATNVGSLSVYPLSREGVTEGSLSWPLPSIAPATFSVHPQLVTRAEVATLRSLLKDAELDTDPDSVDNLSTHEFYLERSGSFEGIAKISGKPDKLPAVYNRRLPIRERLAEVVRPIMSERILPLVNARYARDCSVDGEEGRCAVCHSLIRRYNEGERMNHPTHFDIQALVTVVVPLATFGEDFAGGLYVSTGAGFGGEEAYLPLLAGDALLHQSTLLHGVNVTSGERWSWILWLKNSARAEECEAVDARGWMLRSATEGDPLAQFLHARRVRSPEEGLLWLERAARSGFTRAANEFGQRLVEAGRNVSEGRAWLEVSARAGEPEGLYNLGLLEATSEGGNVTAAVVLFRQAAERGLSAAAANMGVAYYNGRGVERSLGEARAWFERAGDERSLLLAAKIAQFAEDAQGTLGILLRAKKAGSREAAKLLLKAAGEGGGAMEL